jgi:hypothetical protein
VPRRLFATLAVATLALSTTAATAASADARKPPPPLKNGFYAPVASVKSAQVGFLVTKHGAKVDQVSLQCTPKDSGQGVLVGVFAPLLEVKNGKLTYSGPATVNDGTFGDEPFATSTLKLRLTHVDGPVVRYTSGGRTFTARTAWKGTVSSPACTSGGQGKVTLFGASRG